MKTTARFNFKIALLIGVFCLAVGMLIYSAFTDFKELTHSTVTVSEYHKPPEPPIVYRHDPELTTVMDELGLDYSKLNLIYGDNPTFPNNKEASYSNGTIYLSPEHSAPLYRLMSHEYIHYAQWIDHETSISFNAYMDELYTGQWLYNRMDGARTQEVCNNLCDIHRELEAVTCTEISDVYLREDFIAWCNKYLPNRSLLFQ